MLPSLLGTEAPETPLLSSKPETAARLPAGLCSGLLIISNRAGDGSAGWAIGAKGWYHLLPPLLPSPEVQAHLAMSSGSLEVVEASEAVLGGEWTCALGEVGGTLCSLGWSPRLPGSWAHGLQHCERTHFLCQDSPGTVTRTLPETRTGPPWTSPPPHDAISFKPCHYLDSFILRGLSPSPAPPSCGVSPTQAVTTRPAHYSLVPLVVSRTKLVLSESF